MIIPVLINIPNKLENSIKLFQIPISLALFGNGLLIKLIILLLSTSIPKDINMNEAINSKGKAIPKNVKKLKFDNIYM